MRRSEIDHLRHHGRFYLAMLCGVAVGGILIDSDPQNRISLAGVIFFLIYLASTAWVSRGLATSDLRRKAAFEDEGIVIIVLVTLIAIVLSLVSLAHLIGSSDREAWLLFVAIANVPLGWATLHTVMAFHYAHLFYAKAGDGGGDAGDAGGLDFPETTEPSVSDFVYYSFTVGMTAQVSDVRATRRQMRNLTLAHAVASFFFNTVIIAFAVSVAASS